MTYLGVALVVAAVVLFILQPVVKGVHASLEREDDELTETEARKRVALLARRDVEYDFLAGKLDEEIALLGETTLTDGWLPEKGDNRSSRIAV